MEKAVYYVGIGASAGGLRALQQLLPSVTANNACYIICQHLSPHHSSLLGEILARDCTLPIHELTQDNQLQPGNIYIAPPNKNIEIENDHITLIPATDEIIPKPSVNQFFTSLGQHHGDKSIGIILSGSGSDGAIGLSSLHASGGLALVQTPESAEYDSMVQAALGACEGCIKGSPKELAELVNGIVSEQMSSRQVVSDQSLQDVISYITAVSGIDFENYRNSTLARRVYRRMSLLHLGECSDYLRVLQSEPAEINVFLQSVFIHVSELFRDPECFELLGQQARAMLDADENLHDIRIWAVGCAKGEEAVSIAIIFEELKHHYSRQFDYKIFATDISVEAIKQARKCRFSLDLCNNVSDEIRTAYFIDRGNALEAKPFIRDKIVFSEHNVLTDPPFSRLNIISCRNLLIYFKSPLQEDVINLFNYSLVDKGLLLLGSVESLTGNQCFETLNEPQKLYKKLSTATYSPIFLRHKGRPVNPFRETTKRNKPFDIETTVLKHLAPRERISAGLIDDKDKLLFTYGDFEQYQNKQEGMVENNVFERMKEEVRATLRALVYKTRRTFDTESSQNGVFELQVDGCLCHIKMVIDVFHSERPGWLLISFYKLPSNIRAENEDREELDFDINNLQKELSVTRENLQTVVEELETSNDQLQLYNQELQSINEEYQSTNEELQTVNEELQSTNEELITVNEELKQKHLAQDSLSKDLFNIQESLDFPMFLLDNTFRVKRFTKRCGDIINLKQLRLDDVFFAVPWLEDMPDLRPFVNLAYEKERLVEHSVTLSNAIYNMQISPYLNHQGVKEGVVISFYDVTSLKHAQQALLVEKNIAETTLNSLSEGVIRVNRKCEVDYMNHAAEQFLQWKMQQTVGNDVSLYMRLFEDDRSIDLKKIILDCIQNNTPFAPQNTFFKAKGHYEFERLVELTITPTSSAIDDLSGGVAVTFKDVTERQSYIKDVLWSSKHDPLTGLVNRKEVELRIDNVIKGAKLHDTESGLLYLDLDQFKVVNDTCGHMAGDELLKQLANVIQTCVRSRDTLARIGGDEFVVLLEKCPPDKVINVARKILHEVSNVSFSWDGKAFKIGVSIGVTSINKDSVSVASLLSNADAACYLSKEQGRNQIQVHENNSELKEIQQHQMKVVSEINEALEHDRLILYFQEIQPTGTCQIGHWEVLVRMFCSDGKFLLPGDFLPAAERFGLINRIDKWVFKNTVEVLKNYFNCDNMPAVNVNVSGFTIGDESYFSLVEELMTAGEIPCDRISFELTETAAMSNASRARHFIQYMKKLGCKIAIDDFGTGMSSLAYLTQLSANILKIDGAFTSGIEKNTVNQTIVESVTNVAHKLDMQVVAEAVETKQQKEVLSKMSVDYIQGYHIGKPIPLEEFISKTISSEKTVKT